jgi:hypothetical protein
MYWVTRNTGGSLARVEMKRLCTMPSGYRSGLVDIASDKPYTIGDFIALSATLHRGLGQLASLTCGPKNDRERRVCHHVERQRG